jgi:hypothetical protein
MRPKTWLFGYPCRLTRIIRSLEGTEKAHIRGPSPTLTGPS